MESSRGPDSGPTGGSKVIDRISIFGGVDLLQLSAVSSSSCLLSYFSSELLPLSPMIPVNWMLLINSCSNFVPLQLCSCCADKCFFNTMPLLLGYSSILSTKLSAAKRRLRKWNRKPPITDSSKNGFLDWELMKCCFLFRSVFDLEIGEILQLVDQWECCIL